MASARTRQQYGCHSTQRGTVVWPWDARGLYQSRPALQESRSKAFWKPHSAASGLSQARWHQALASCPQARAAPSKSCEGCEPGTGGVGLSFCPQQVGGGEGRHFSCKFAFSSAFILIAFI